MQGRLGEIRRGRRICEFGGEGKGMNISDRSYARTGRASDSKRIRGRVKVEACDG